MLWLRRDYFRQLWIISLAAAVDKWSTLISLMNSTLMFIRQTVVHPFLGWHAAWPRVIGLPILAHGHCIWCSRIDQAPAEFQNWKQLNKSLARWASKQGHTLITPPPDWRGVSGLEQARILAGTDVHIGMHGAGMSLSAFQPPGSLVLEIFPRGFKYCRQSTCLSHDGLLWVQLQQDAIPHVNELSRFKMTKNREMGRAVDVNRFINMLDQAFRIDMWSALGMAKPADCPAKTLDGWAKMWLNRAARVPHAACMHALPASGLTPAYDGLHGMRRRNYSSLKQQGKTKQLQRVTGWPACVSSVVPL